MTSAALPPGVAQAPIDHLHVALASIDALSAAGIHTIGELAGAGYLVAEAWDALGRTAGREVADAVALVRNIGGDPFDWSAYWAEREVAIVPGGTAQDGGVGALLVALPQVVRAALADDPRAGTDTERDWLIIDARNGLVSAERTLEELGGAALGISRARVQQLEAKAVKRLVAAFTRGFVGRGYRLAPDLAPALRMVSRSVPGAGIGTFEDELASHLGIDPGDDNALSRRLAFLLRLGGAHRVPADGERRPAIWIDAGDPSIRRSIAVADRVARFLTETTGAAHSETDIVVALNRGHRKDLLVIRDVQAAMPYCRAAERVDGERWQGRFELLRGRGDQAYRLISQAGKPVDLDDMAREINARVGGRPLGVRNLSNQLSADDRFIPIGKSGEWGLRAEHAADAASILAMMTETLRKAGKPLDAAVIEAAVSARRKVADGSVVMYLTMRPEFTRLADGTWALSEWPEAAKGAAPAKARRPRMKRAPTLADRMEAVLVPYLQASPGATRPLLEVVVYVAESLGVIRNTVYAYLGRIASVERAEVDGQQVVRLVAAGAATVSDLAGRIRALAATGETPRVEFKSTLRWNVHAAMDDPSLQKMCTKTIAAFSNTMGGTLLIGIAPDGSTFGLEADCAVLQKSDDTCVDAFSRTLAAITAQHLGGRVAAQVVTHFADIDGHAVCMVEVPAGREPAYLRDGKTVEFYVRNGTTSRALELPEVAPYIASRWP